MLSQKFCLTPSTIAISHGRAAAAKIFDTIARVPPIDSASEEGLKPDHVEGHITLENVVFDYPARPDVKVLRGINLDFPAGRTAALVGASGSG
jgi:ATP-binding cassette subfamily B (MDR/TAP) protein 1